MYTFSVAVKGPESDTFTLRTSEQSRTDDRRTSSFGGQIEDKESRSKSKESLRKQAIKN